MGFWVTVAIYAGLYVINRWVLPKTPEGNKERRTQDDSPTVRDGVTIPIWYGKCRFDSPNLVWNSPRRLLPTNGNNQDVWGANMLFVLGIPGGIVSPNPSTYDRKVTWDDLEINGIRMVSDSGQDFYVADVFGFDYDMNLFTENLGIFALQPSDLDNGIFGTIIVRDGFYGLGPYGCAEFSHATGQPPEMWPGYRNQTTMLCVGGQGLATLDTLAIDNPRARNFAFGPSTEAPNLPSIIITMTNPCTMMIGATEVLSVENGNPNPVAVLYDILTNDWARVGLPASKIDLTSFTTAAATLAAEGHSWGGFITDPASAVDVIRDIMVQINGVIYEDPKTRQLRLKLVRYDYTVGALPLFDTSNVSEVVQFSTSTFGESHNTVRITYTDAYDNFGTRTAVAQDLANITAQGGRVRAVTIDMPHVRNSTTANQIASRELNEVSLPMASLKIRANRDGYPMRFGDAFRFTWPELNMVDVVFRIQHIDFGQLGAEDVIIDAVQDVFALDLSSVVTTVPFPNPPILPIQERTFTEAPRYFNVQAQASGFISDPNQGHLWYLSTPAQSDSNGFGIYEYDDDFVRTVADMFPFEPVAYPARASVRVAYARTLDPYDTTTGLQLEFFSDSSVLKTASVTDIRTRGKNLVIVGNEIIAYETFTSLGADVYRLNNVWRGLFDTPTVAHEIGERVYFLSDGIGSSAQFFVGRKAHLYAGDTANARFLPYLGGIGQNPDAYGVETDRLVARNRQLLPYPPSDMRVNLLKTIARLDEEGIHVDWKYRNRLTTQVIRGNDASETVPVTTEYRIKVQKTGPFLLTGATTTVDTRTDEDSFCTTTTAGYGQIDTMIAAFDTAEAVESWDPVRVAVVAPPWRNLLANANFDDTLATYVPAWVIVTGADRGSDTTRAHSSTSPFYITADGVNEEIDVSQTLDITGYHPERLAATLTFYVKIHTASTDVATVTLSALDSASTVLTSTTFGPTAPSTAWVRQTLQIANLPANTAKLRVRVQGDHDEDQITTILFSDFTLRVGQTPAAESLLNGDFQTGGGSLTSWTTVSGTWTAATTAGYDGNVVATQTSTGTSELRQDVTLPAGYEFGTAVVSWAQLSDGTGDTGQVIIEARSGGGATLASSSSTAAAITPLQRWAAGQLVIENIPVDTATIRVRLIAVADTTSDVMFDGVSLQFHKELDPDETLSVDFLTPRGQRRPLDRGDWVEAFPTVPMPDYGMYTHANFIGGALRGRLGIEPPMNAPSGARTGKFVGLYDPEEETITGSVVELRAADEGLASTDPRLYGAFDLADPFTVICIFRNRLASTGTSYGLCGRMDQLGIGWALEVTSGGFCQARLEDSVSTAVATRGTAVKDGHPWFAALIYDPIAEELHCIDPSGTTTVSTVSMASFKPENLTSFRIGKAASSDTCLDGQIDVHLWRQALTPSQVASIWTHGIAEPAVTANARTGAVVVAVGQDIDGELITSYHQTQTPVGKLDGDDADFGLAATVAMTNLAPFHDFTNTTSWPRDGSPTVTVDKMAPLGFADGMSITGTNAQGVRNSNATLSATVNVHVTWWARTAGSAHNARLQLRNSSGVVKGTADYPVVSTWTRYDFTFTTWDASTAAGHVIFFGSDTGSSQEVQIAGPIHVEQTTESHVAIPYSGAVAASELTFVGSAVTHFNHEGEIFLETQAKHAVFAVQRDIAIVDNGTNTNDARTVRYNSSSNAQLVHNDGTGTGNTATSSGTDWSGFRTIRGRWNRAGLVEAASAFTAINRSGVSTTGRATIWTPSAVGPTRLRLPASNLLISRVKLFAREVVLGQAV